MSKILELKDLLPAEEGLPLGGWRLKAVQSDQCISYVAWNEVAREALLIDPKVEDVEAYRSLFSGLSHYLWLAVIDSHTHADHVSIASQLSKELKAPYVMHALSPNTRVDIRVSRDTILSSHAGPVRVVSTPGHSPDSVTVIWGPFLFGGDTLLYGDTGRDDLPGGDSEAHFESIQKLKALVLPDSIVLPGHDPRGGRASSWKEQLAINPSLTQGREAFVREAREFDAPAPSLLMRSLRENFK